MLGAISVDLTSQRGSPFPAATVRHTLFSQSPSTAPAPLLDVFASKAEPLQSLYNPAADQAIYLWGTAVHHSGLAGSALLGWCASAAEDGRHERLRELIGHYVIFIDDRRRRRVSFISDPLGVRPWFVGTFDGRLVAGSDVLGICDAGLSTGNVNYDAVSSWLNYNFDCTGGSVVADYARLPGGSLCTFDHAGKLLGQNEYASLTFTKNNVPASDLVDQLHDIVSRSFDCLARSVNEASVPLSGGYDSRYVCALAAQRGGMQLHLATVESYPEEALAARQVAAALQLPLHLIPVDSHVLDLFDDPLAFGSDGFPTARNLTSAVARRHPGVPVISGFMGDVLMRAPLTEGLRQFLARDDEDLTDEQFAAAAHQRYRLKTNRLDLLRDHVAPRAEERARRAMLRMVQRGRGVGRPLAFTNLYLRHRLYFAAIFLGHLDVAEAILPFYSWELIAYNARHQGSFAPDTYERLFQRHFPRLAHVPHDSQLKSSEGPRSIPPIGHMRWWSADLLRSTLAGRNASGITSHKLLARAGRGLLFRGTAQFQAELMFLHKIRAFEQRLRRAGINMDWSAV